MVYDHEQDEQVVMDFERGSLSRNGVPLSDKDARLYLVSRIRHEADQSKIVKAISALRRLFT